jgi:hypothetical protein
VTEPTEAGGSGIGAQHAGAPYVSRLPVLQRRERFATRHPGIEIRARREDGQMRFYVSEPGHSEPAMWTDPAKMMDALEARYP